MDLNVIWGNLDNKKLKQSIFSNSMNWGKGKIRLKRKLLGRMFIDLQIWLVELELDNVEYRVQL